MSRGTLLVTAVTLPLAMLFACLSVNGRKNMVKWLWVAPVPALAAAVFGSWNSPVILSGAPYQVTLMLDVSGCMLMIAAACSGSPQEFQFQGIFAIGLSAGAFLCAGCSR